MKKKRSLLAAFVRYLGQRKRNIILCMDPYSSPGWQAIDNVKVPSVRRPVWKKTGAAGGYCYITVSKMACLSYQEPVDVCKKACRSTDQLSDMIR